MYWLVLNVSLSWERVSGINARGRGYGSTGMEGCLWLYLHTFRAAKDFLLDGRGDLYFWIVLSPTLWSLYDPSQVVQHELECSKIGEFESTCSTPAVLEDALCTQTLPLSWLINSEFEHLNVIYGVPFLGAHILTFNVAPTFVWCFAWCGTASLAWILSCASKMAAAFMGLSLFLGNLRHQSIVWTSR